MVLVTCSYCDRTYTAIKSVVGLGDFTYYFAEGNSVAIAISPPAPLSSAIACQSCVKAEALRKKAQDGTT